MTKPRGHRWVPVLVSAVVLLAATLRLVNLNFHSLDLDESMSVWLALKPAGELIANTLNLSWDPHPPGYYLALKGWMALAGDGEFAVRLLSALSGIAFVWLTYLLGTQLLDPGVGLTAAVLSAVNPLLVWLSQETRMYTPVATLTLSSVYCLVRALDDRRWWWWLGYALLALAGCYAHLFGSLLLPVAAVYVAVRGLRDRSQWGWGALAIGGVALAYVPYARNAWRGGQAAPEINVYPDLNLGEQLFALAKGFTVRFLPDPPRWLWLPLVLVLVTLVLGLWPTGRRGKRAQGNFAGLLLLVWLLIPLVAFIWINARRPAFNAKYLVVVAPAIWLAVAAGIVRIGRWSRWAAAAAIVPPLLLSALGWRYVWNTDVLREDWRTAAAYVSQRATLDDHVFVHLHYARVPFEFYYDGVAPVVAPLGSHPPPPEDLDGLLAPYADSAVLWLVQSQEHNTDPHHIVERWFAERGPLVTEQYPVGMSVKAFALRYRLDGLPATALPAQIRFGESLRLVGYTIDQSHLRPDSDRLHPPSNWIHLTLYWQVDRELEQGFATVVEMSDGQGGVWGGKLEQPWNVLRVHAPTEWRPGEVIRDDYDINLNPATPAGTYHIRIGVRGDLGETFWPVSGAADHDGRAILTDVQIETAGGR